MRRNRNKKISIYRELGLLLVFAAAVSALLFVGLHRAVTEGINRFAWNEDYLSREDARQLESLQQFIRQNGLRLEDAERLTGWVRRQAVVSIQIYRGGELYYDSDYDEYDREDFGGEIGLPLWADLRNVTFADGDAQVLLYGFYVFRIYHYALIVELLVVFSLFLTIVMLGIRREIRYIRSLSREIKILEGGGLEYPITVSGRDELTELAQGLDAMRLSFLEQNRQEKQLAQASQRMITEMSHDLRTPLTSIMLYTEILLGRKFKGEGQMMEYVEKIDKKARRLLFLLSGSFHLGAGDGHTFVHLAEIHPGGSPENRAISPARGFLPPGGGYRNPDGAAAGAGKAAAAWEDLRELVSKKGPARLCGALASKAAGIY